MFSFKGPSNPCFWFIKFCLWVSRSEASCIFSETTIVPFVLFSAVCILYISVYAFEASILVKEPSSIKMSKVACKSPISPAIVLTKSLLLFPDNNFLEPRTLVAPIVITAVSITLALVILSSKTCIPICLFTKWFMPFSATKTGSSSRPSSLAFSLPKEIPLSTSCFTVNFLPFLKAKFFIWSLIPWKPVNSFSLLPAIAENIPSRVDIACPAFTAIFIASFSLIPVAISWDLMSSTLSTTPLVKEARPIPILPAFFGPKYFFKLRALLVLWPPLINANNWINVLTPPLATEPPVQLTTSSGTSRDLFLISFSSERGIIPSILTFVLESNIVPFSSTIYSYPL